jgi:hypothetical protein
MLQAQASTRTYDERDELDRHLAGAHFPASAESLMARALHRQAPSSVLWQLNRLPRQRQFHSPEDVRDFVDAAAHPTLSLR